MYSAAKRSPGPVRAQLHNLMISAALAALLTAGVLSPAVSQTQTAGLAKPVEMILSNLPAAGSPDYKALQKNAGNATGQSLDMTKSEMWSVQQTDIDAFLRTAARLGVRVTRLGENWNHVFRAKPADSGMTRAQKKMMKRTLKSKAAKAVGLMSVPPAAMMEYALTKDYKPGVTVDKDNLKPAPQIIIPLNDKTSITVNRTSFEPTEKGCIWRGRIKGTDQDVTLMWWSGGRLNGTINHDGKKYSIKNMGGTTHAVVEIDPNAMPPDHAPMPAPRNGDANLKDYPLDPLVRQGDASVLRRFYARQSADIPRDRKSDRINLKTRQKNLQDVLDLPQAGKADDARTTAKATGLAPEPVTIKLLVAYTAKAAANYMDIKRDLIALAVEEANQTYRNSALDHVKIEVAHVYKTDYDEGGARHFEHVWRFADKGDGFMEEVHRLRDEKRADVTVLIVDDPSGCGLATRVAADENEAFAVVHHECAAMTYSLAHEVGHIIGARHDRSLDQSKLPFPYGHGYVNGLKWRTVMSYSASCKGCPRLPVWSNPDVKIKKEPAGDGSNNNARVIRNHASRVADFR